MASTTAPSMDFLGLFVRERLVLGACFGSDPFLLFLWWQREFDLSRFLSGFGGFGVFVLGIVCVDCVAYVSGSFLGGSICLNLTEGSVC